MTDYTRELFNSTKSHEQISMEIGSSTNISSVCQCSVSTNKNIVKPSNIKVEKGKKNIESSKVSYSKVDKRVSLTCSPKTAARDETLFINKVKYVLGTKKQRPSWVMKGSYFYGLLRNALGSSSGLIFPYTPNISFSHSVNYDTVDITHSNISYNYYRNTPPPSITLDANFTADNRENALHMLSAIWFLSACTKCDFGDRSEGQAGLPPPVLYLNGYDSLVDNIPVVINSVSYSYPKDKHYVNLILDMSKNYEDGEVFCKIYDSYTTTYNTKTTFEKNKSMEASLKDAWNQTGYSESLQGTKKHGIDLSFWLPTEISINIQLRIQPNLLKNRQQWSLDDYKTGMLMTTRGKNPPISVTNFIEETGKPLLDKCGCETGEMELVEHVSTTSFIPSGWTW